MRVALAMLLGCAVFEARAATQVLKARLVSSGVEPKARGKVLLVLRDGGTGLDAKLEIVVRRLNRRATFEVALQGVRIGTLATRDGGNGRARFRNHPRHHEQRLGADPRGKVIVIRNAAGTDLLAARLPGQSADAAHVQCCVAGGNRCETITSDECTAAGGIDRGAGSCLPDPCASPASSPPVVCCVPDADGPQCALDTEADCAASSGIVLDGGTCDPDPCAPMPPPDDEVDIRCCTVDDDGTHECNEESVSDCLADDGVPMGPGDCDEMDPCGSSDQ